MSARWKNSRVSAGASSGSLHFFFPESLLFRMRIPHRNNVPCVAARRPNHNNQAAVEKTGGDVTRFACRTAARWICCGSPTEHLSGPGKVETSLLHGLEAFCLGPCNRHPINVPPLI